MIEVTVINNTEIPEGATVTQFAMQKKVFAVFINGGGSQVWVGRNKIRQYKKHESALIKQANVYMREHIIAKKLYKTLAGKGKLIISKRNNLPSKKQVKQTGFEYVI